MSATINNLRDLVAARIPELTLPAVAYTVTTRAGKEVTAENCADAALIIVGSAGQQFERISRGNCRGLPIVAVVVHRKLPVNGEGEPDQTQLDQCVELCEALGQQLMTKWPGATPVTVEQPSLYDGNALVETGIFRSRLLVTFTAEFEA